LHHVFVAGPHNTEYAARRLASQRPTRRGLDRVSDVMALRGDAIDNIPRSAGHRDKGSVEIIKRFGTVEQALERAAEVEKKTYRESLLNNRETILFSKSMATIDTNVPVEFDGRGHACGSARC